VYIYVKPLNNFVIKHIVFVDSVDVFLCYMPLYIYNADFLMFCNMKTGVNVVVVIDVVVF